jgi:hypothetical protein
MKSFYLKMDLNLIGNSIDTKEFLKQSQKILQLWLNYMMINLAKNI